MKRHWNYRVIEFPSLDGDAWLAIHEVHYVDGRPTSCSETPAAIGWNLSEGDVAPISIIEHMCEAPGMPALKAEIFAEG